ncbi:MAG: hypothetical protein ACI9EF_001302 [Pseudohongiellaceae bacterium]|jgi:hypothetical protein
MHPVGYFTTASPEPPPLSTSKNAMTDKQPIKGPALPVSPPSKGPGKPTKPGAPDLHIEEIEEKHVPKDRNIFDK